MIPSAMQRIGIVDDAKATIEKPSVTYLFAGALIASDLLRKGKSQRSDLKVVVTLPDGVEFVISYRDFTIATIAAPTIMVEETAEDEEGEEGEGGTEGADDEDGGGDSGDDAEGSGDGGEDD